VTLTYRLEDTAAGFYFRHREHATLLPFQARLIFQSGEHNKRSELSNGQIKDICDSPTNALQPGLVLVLNDACVLREWTYIRRVAEQVLPPNATDATQNLVIFRMAVTFVQTQQTRSERKSGGKS